MPTRPPTPSRSWVPMRPDHPFGPQTLPYGSFTGPDSLPHVGVAIGDHILDVTAAWRMLAVTDEDLFAAGSLDRFLAAGPATWSHVRTALTEWLCDASYQESVSPFLLSAHDVSMLLPFTVADYADFYASEHHAANLGRMFRPGSEPLTPNWKHMPIGYHGRAGTVVVSGTPVIRPRGQRRSAAGDVTVGPSLRLDIEAELGFVVGVPTAMGETVALDDFDSHVFGVCLVNDWSARDLQAWEYVPLGPFLGKSFATSVSPWVVPLSALRSARVAPPPRDPKPVPYLDDSQEAAWGLDVRLEVALNGTTISEPGFAQMYWTAAQQLAHMTVNGARLRTGDLFASGTISGPTKDSRGSLIELTWNGLEPLTVPGGRRTFLEDGDEVVITATAPGPAGTRVGLGEVRGTVLPTPEPPAPSGAPSAHEGTR
ncbi:fumarylacetoacetase [Streptomyces cucumeris]|uniref:fumarylacetoacetase n=1 Tax=Streptomyces cucumeris TaxID=2962890 RepID=UPI0020C89A4D|nr:fumarylacetoacetase [Streptomyces sp. NEAU-Y11]MCP9211125.1 fumarylacetoacetase [Streptomyces sp. NEAU-Y11]